MEDVIEVSPSGRAKCRSCKVAIPKGEVRFGEVYESAFAGGEAVRYWHLACAAKKLPSNVKAAMDRYGAEIPDRAAIDALIDEASKKGKASAKAALPNADVAPTGRAKCISCGEPIEKGQLRVAVERDVEAPSGMPIKGAGYLHPGCASGWAEEQGQDPGELLETVIGNSDHLSEAQVAELNAGFEG